MKERLLYLYCRGKAEWIALKDRLAVREVLYGEEGQLGKIAVAVILAAVAVGLAVAVAAILGPRILGLAERTGSQIESVPLDWGQ
ncbi:MAG TPA: hypothetical protein G4O00_07300 [Thermoflexia bacterium]|jgi:hypothetical protein|nr:hypothetical protein [Thermoflexia bacterium]